MSFVKKEISDGISFDPYKVIGSEWALVTAGDMQSHNTMTVSWGQTGVLWNKPVFTAYIRTSRKTFEFTESNEYFTVSFFGGGQKEALSFCGSHSGRDCDKEKETGLIPVELDGSVAYEQAERVFVCRKLYIQDMAEECFTDKENLKFYEKDPYHRMYVGEIVSVFEKE